MDLPLVMAALMNRWGEDILPEEVAYAMEDKATSSTGNAAFAAAAAGCSSASGRRSRRTAPATGKTVIRTLCAPTAIRMR